MTVSATEVGVWENIFILLRHKGDLVWDVLGLDELSQGGSIGTSYINERYSDLTHEGPASHGLRGQKTRYLPTTTRSKSLSSAGMSGLLGPPPMHLAYLETSPLALDLAQRVFKDFEIMLIFKLILNN